MFWIDVKSLSPIISWLLSSSIDWLTISWFFRSYLNSLLLPYTRFLIAKIKSFYMNKIKYRDLISHLLPIQYHSLGLFKHLHIYRLFLLCFTKFKKTYYFASFIFLFPVYHSHILTFLHNPVFKNEHFLPWKIWFYIYLTCGTTIWHKIILSKSNKVTKSTLSYFNRD